MCVTFTSSCPPPAGMPFYVCLEDYASSPRTDWDAWVPECAALAVSSRFSYLVRESSFIAPLSRVRHMHEESTGGLQLLSILIWWQRCLSWESLLRARGGSCVGKRGQHAHTLMRVGHADPSAHCCCRSCPPPHDPCPYPYPSLPTLLVLEGHGRGKGAGLPVR